MTKIIVYSTPSCPHCTSAKKYFKELGFSFKDIDVSKDQRAADLMVKKTHQMGVPVIEIGNQIIIGFDKQRIKKVLEI